MLRSAAGERPGTDVPISVETLDRLSPPPHAAATVGRHFADAGFSVLGAMGNTVVVAADKEAFERHFGVDLVYGADGSYTCQPPRPRKGVRQSSEPAEPAVPAESASAAQPADPTNVPIEKLPPTVRRLVAAVALDTSAVIDTDQIDT